MNVKNITPVVIKPKSVVADVVIPKEHDIKVSSRNFILASSSAMNLAGGVNIPEWLNAAITTEIARGTTDLATLISNLDDFLRGLEEGVNQQIIALQTADESNHSLITTNVSRLDNDVAAVVDITNTKVTADQSSALALQVVTAQFITPGSEANAWFVNSASVMATDIGAHAASITGLVADYNGLSVSLLSTEYVDIDGEQWEVGASKLAYGPNGNITGWSFTDGSALRSEFVISADHFYIESASQPSYKPFTVDTIYHEILFNGKVEFTGLGIDSDSTTIDGGKIEANTVHANRLTTTYAWVGGSLQSSDFSTVGGAGFRLKANAADSYSDPTIYGAYIRGGTIDAALLKASSITYGGAILLAEGVTTGNESGRSGYSVGNSLYVGDVGSGGDYLTLGTIVMPLYSSGFDRRRALSTDSNIMVSITGSLDVEFADVTTIYLEIQRSISGGAWTSVKTLSNPVYRYNNISYGAYNLSCIWSGTLAGISTTGYVSYRARLRTNASTGHFGNLAGFISLQN